MRVVSLLPAATEIVASLGAANLLVGVSHECDYPPAVRALPRVTRTTVDTSRPSGEIDRAVAEAKRRRVPPIEIDRDALARLAPDVVIGQSVCEVCAVGADELARSLGGLDPKPRVVTLHAHTLDGVLANMLDVGEALDLRDEAEELVAGLRYRLSRVRRRAAHAPTAPRPRVLVLEWLDPPYVAGHWVPELVEIAGGANLGNRTGEPSRPKPWRELRSLSPDVVVIALCGFGVPRARQELAAVTDPDARALVQARTEFLDGNAYTSRPGPRLVDAAEILAQLMRG